MHKPTPHPHQQAPASHNPARRRALAWGMGSLALSGPGWAMADLPASAAPSQRASATAVHHLGAAWRRVVPARAGLTKPNAHDFVGVLALDWAANTVRVVIEHAVPTRAHGVMAEAGGGFLVLAARPGSWMRRLDGQGQVVLHHELATERPARSLDGHVVASANGQWLYTPETDRQTGEGWVSVRDARNFSKQAEWPTHGRDPHQCVRDATGALVLANGGIARAADGKKRDLDQMDSSLVRLDGDSGALLGQWRLADARLSLRHLAWASGAAQPLLGIALQAEHSDPSRRAAAPVLAVWNGQTLTVPTPDTAASGYAGDIAPGPGGGFVLSGQRVGRGVLWHPDAPEQLFPVAELTELCALATPGGSGRNGVLMATARGVARWHPSQPPATLPWPVAMAPDNHWVLLG